MTATWLNAEGLIWVVCVNILTILAHVVLFFSFWRQQWPSLDERAQFYIDSLTGW